MNALDRLTDVKSWNHETEDYDAGLPEVKEYDGEFSDIKQAAAELSALRARVEALEADKERTLEAVKMARQKLRSTQINWQEGCLFDCDSYLNIALDVCPSCTWRGDVSLVDGECPYCKTNWHELRKAA